MPLHYLTSTALAPTGRMRQLEAPKRGEGWVFLDWKQPVDGGSVIAYNIERRSRTDGAWQDVATAIETEATLVEQPKGKELDYRVIPINLVTENPPSWFCNRGKSGKGTASNTVEVVL